MFKCRKGVKSSVPSAIGSVGSMLDNTEMGCQPRLCAEHVPWGLWAVLGSLVSLLPSSNSLVAANTQHAPGLLKNKLRRKSKSLFFFSLFGEFKQAVGSVKLLPTSLWVDSRAFMSTVTLHL